MFLQKKKKKMFDKFLKNAIDKKDVLILWNDSQQCKKDSLYCVKGSSAIVNVCTL